MRSCQWLQLRRSGHARDLEAVVSASGKIQPKRLVNISADTSGRVVNLAVNEGDRVSRGSSFCRSIPRSLAAGRRWNRLLQAAEAPPRTAPSIRRDRPGSIEQAQQNLTRQRDSPRSSSPRVRRSSAPRTTSSRPNRSSASVKEVGPQSARINQERATLDPPPDTISARSRSSRRSTASSPGATSRRARPSSSGP